MTVDEMLAIAKPIEGWMYDDELIWLFHAASECKSVVEIGVWCGRSTAAICCGIPDGGTVYAVDHFGGSPEEDDAHARAKSPDGRMALIEQASKNLIRFPCCTLFIGGSLDTAPALPDGLDMVFIDGGHDYPSVTGDIDAYFPKIRHGGMICGHDRHWPGVSEAIKDRFGVDKIHAGAGSIWWVKK